jgi:hypothetical protein
MKIRSIIGSAAFAVNAPRSRLLRLPVTALLAEPDGALARFLVRRAPRRG